MTGQRVLDHGEAIRTLVELRPATARPCGWFIVVTDYDGFANLHGPYWDTERLVEKYESLQLVAHFSPVAELNVIPVEGITAAP